MAEAFSKWQDSICNQFTRFNLLGLPFISMAVAWQADDYLEVYMI